MKISTNGFFKGCVYRLALWGCGLDHYKVPDNICPLFWRVVWGCIMIVFITALSSVVSLVFLDPVVSFLLWMLGVGSGYYFSDITLFLGVMMYAIGSLVALAVWFSETESGQSFSNKIASSAEKMSETSSTWQIIKKWYKSVHDKTCFKVEFKEEK